ncbi:MAG: hypothetical protein KAQ92_01560, partial [Candidatus Aenigmarchaeota archaeon]|nr:hypothetical protein [Candidatus Aenigmarchaeota archaeon]
MSELLNFINKQEENNDFLTLNSQNKVIIFGSLFSSILIVITAWVVINNTQQTILQSYYNFGSMLAKTLAANGTEFVKNYQNDENQIKFEEYSKNIVT